jgi:hypothetical protein
MFTPGANSQIAVTVAHFDCCCRIDVFRAFQAAKRVAPADSLMEEIRASKNASTTVQL